MDPKKTPMPSQEPCIRNGNFERLWDSYSATTMNHINSFIDTFGIHGGGKAWWTSLEVVAY